MFISTIEANAPVIEQDEHNIIISGTFLILENEVFELVKTTGIPHKINENMYTVLDTPSTFIAVNNNQLTYFELITSELQRCVCVSKHTRYCIQNRLRSIVHNSNCVIDEIYNRLNKTKCEQHIFKFGNLLWKQLYRTNTWMFLTNGVQSIDVICAEQREEVHLNGTGIILINSH